MGKADFVVRAQTRARMAVWRRENMLAGCGKVAFCRLLKNGPAFAEASRRQADARVASRRIRSDFCHADEAVRRPESRNREK
jgi:hypothetical protein